MKYLILAAICSTSLFAAECPTPRFMIGQDSCEIGSEECPWNPDMLEFVGRAEQVCKEKFGPEACLHAIEKKGEEVELHCGPKLRQAAR